MRSALLIAVVLAVPVLAGCLAGPGPDDDGSGPAVPGPAAVPRVVVAVIDTGIDPYHEHFRSAEILPDALLDSFVNTLDGEPPWRVAISTEGTYEERFEADEAVWDAMEPRRLYHFEGTRVLGISFTGASPPVLDVGGHGTGTAASVLDANPDALVVMVQGIDGDAEAWAAAQPWVDFLSMSYGPPGSVPYTAGPVFGLTTSQATRLAWESGKVPVGAADNTPAPAPNDETAGPPWVLGVAGDDPEGQCREHVSALFPDFTAAFTQELPRSGTVDEYRWMSGTSFATPTTAGVASRVLLEVREAWGHAGGITEDGALAVSPDGVRLGNTDLREALNRTAVYFGTQACLGGTALPVNPVAPWLQMGWGHVGPEAVGPAVAHLLGVEEAPPKPDAAVAYMESWHTYRTQVWENAP